MVHLSLLTESHSFTAASDEIRQKVLASLQRADTEIQKQALRLCESANKGGEVAAVLTYFAIREAPDYLTRPCRVTLHPTLKAIAPESKAPKRVVSAKKIAALIAQGYSISEIALSCQVSRNLIQVKAGSLP